MTWPDDGVNHEVLRELRGMLGNRLDAVLAAFGTQAHDLTTAALQSLQEGDLARVQATAHTLKGAAGAVGATQLSALAGQLERHAATGDVPAAAAVATRLTPTVAETVQALQAS